MQACLSLSIPTMMLLLLYVMDITDFSTEGEVKLLKYAHMLEIAIRPEEQAVPDDVLFINISYDKELVPVYDEYGMPMGNIDVTDREKLWKLLCAAERNGSYNPEALCHRRKETDSQVLVPDTGIVRNPCIRLSTYLSWRRCSN